MARIGKVTCLGHQARIRNPICFFLASAAAHAVSFVPLARFVQEEGGFTELPPSYTANSTNNTAKPSSPANLAHSPRSDSFPLAAIIVRPNHRWHIPLLSCRALSTVPALWWGLRCALTFLGELLRSDGSEIHDAWTAEKTFRVTEVFLAILWCSAAAYLSFFFTDCLMSRWLLFYTPSATVVRLLTTNVLIAYITSWVLYLSGASEDPRMLLPAWISIATTLTLLYHITHRQINIKRETTASIGVFSIASFVSMCSLLLQLHLTRMNDPEVPLFLILQSLWESIHEAATGRRQ